MRIAGIKIKKLFGMFDHYIPFNRVERITIIHGPNGIGKTTILRLLFELFSQHFGFFLTLPFKSIEIEFDDKKRLQVKRELQRSPQPWGPEPQETIRFILYVRHNAKRRWVFNPKNEFFLEYDPRMLQGREHVRRHVTDMLERFLPWLDRVGPARWRDNRTRDLLSFDEVISHYGDRLPADVKRLLPPSWLKTLLASLPTHFIETQRLFLYTEEEKSERRSERRSATVEQYSASMAMGIQDKLRELGALSAYLDRTFPQRLLQEGIPSNINDRKIRDKYREQAKYRERLMNAGLIAPEEQVTLPASKLKESDIKVLWHYLNDVDQKLRVFDDLLRKVELFKDVINTRFLYKQLSIDKEKGFVLTTEKNDILAPTSLSSGEQHELVLAYQLIFIVKPKTLILIDEPELSLHVTWQHMFLEDLTRISRLVDLDFVIATHSPSIVHKRTDLMIPLEGPAK